MSDQTNGNGRLDRIEEALSKLAELSLRNEFNIASYRKASNDRMEQIEASQQRTQAMLEHLTKIVGGIGDNTNALEKFRARVAEAAQVQPGDYPVK